MRDILPSIGARRLLVLVLCLASLFGIAGWGAHLAGSHPGGWGSGLVILLFLGAAPWALLGFWNAVLGFVVARLVADPIGYTNPAIARTPPDAPIVTRTAICLALRNEAVTAVFARLEAMVESIVAAGATPHVDFHILSDTNRPDVAAVEETAFAALRARYPAAGFLNYRRRLDNAGFKAGNLLEFAERGQHIYAHMIVLDADSIMTAAAMLRLVRVMQANPQLGILQTLVVGRPAENAFARIFQYGMRHGMRMQTIGSAWWQGESGPFWGHNAIIRTGAFVRHCRMPIVPGPPPLGGHVLSHDQVEAALMRAAGYEVRVIPEAFGSWEENPPSLPDFLKRDLRWGQGNIQYIKLLPMLDLKPMGKYQLVNAILMYLGSPMAFLMLLTGLVSALAGAAFAARLAFALYALILALCVVPRLIGCAETLLKADGARRYGGPAHLIAGSAIDMVFSWWLGPIMLVSQSLFVAGLGFGRQVIWDAQNRHDRSVGLVEAARGTWPQMLFGLISCTILALAAPDALPWAWPSLIPCLLVVPFAWATATPGLGRWLVRHRLCAVPDETALPAELSRAEALVALKSPA